jgi:DNA topoisomerase-1
MDGEAVTLETALGLLSLPRVVGLHPETGQKLEVGLGRFGPYVKMGSLFGSLDKDDDLLAIGLNRAVDVIARKMASVRVIGQHPKDKTDIQVRKGRFGPYVQHGQTVANLPRAVTMEEITLIEAVALLAEKGKQLKPKPGRGGKKPVAKQAVKEAVKPTSAKMASPKNPDTAAKQSAVKAAAKAKPASAKAKPAAAKAKAPAAKLSTRP